MHSETLSTSPVSIIDFSSHRQSDVLTCVSSIASKGSGAHLLKAGSKRRRTQAEMKDQYEQKQLEDVQNREYEVRLSDSTDRIAALEQQLMEMQEENEKGEMAKNLMQGMLDKGELT